MRRGKRGRPVLRIRRRRRAWRGAAGGDAYERRSSSNKMIQVQGEVPDGAAMLWRSRG